MNTHTIVVLAENRDGVLSRITALFDARGYRIESIAVGPALDPSTVRIVVVVRGDERVVEQVTKQLGKLIEVLKVGNLTAVPHIARETMLVRVAARPESRAEITRIAETFRARIVDQTADTYVLEVTGEESKVDSIVELLRPFGIHELVRTGKIAIARGVGLRPTIEKGPTGRRHPRHPVGFEVRVAALDAQARLRAHDLSAGGMSLRTNAPVDLGATLDLQLVHPRTGQQFSLRAIVRRAIVRADFRGIGVEFVELDEAHRRGLDEFISGESPAPTDCASE